MAVRLAEGPECNEATLRRQLAATPDVEGLEIVSDCVEGTYRLPK